MCTIIWYGFPSMTHQLTWVFNECQEDKLGSMSKERDEQNHVGCGHQRDSVVSSISDRVHWVWRHLEHAIERQRLFDQKEKVAPVYMCICVSIYKQKGRKRMRVKSGVRAYCAIFLACRDYKWLSCKKSRHRAVSRTYTRRNP